ncbi:MAG TPA: hypothetical protein DCS93_25545 [Microscillaceae bacterium]|nr:hypothetical protein [Microscillaceae bacterium]
MIYKVKIVHMQRYFFEAYKQLIYVPFVFYNLHKKKVNLKNEALNELATLSASFFDIFVLKKLKINLSFG